MRKTILITVLLLMMYQTAYSDTWCSGIASGIYYLYGQVTDESSKPIKGVAVWQYLPPTREFRFVAYTRWNGTWMGSVQCLESGIYDIMYDKYCYQNTWRYYTCTFHNDPEPCNVGRVNIRYTCSCQ